MSSVEAFSRMIAEATEKALDKRLAPLAKTIERLTAEAEEWNRFRADIFQSFSQSRGYSRAGAKTSPGKASSKLPFLEVPPPLKRGSAGSQKGCGVKGCDRPSRTLGYCSAHYQKFRMLSKRGQLPTDWVENPTPGSVENVLLPRGRAASKTAKAA